LILSSALSAQNSTTAGEFTVEPATLVSLGFEWRITGDDNRNAKVEPSYRKKGESSWRTALPLMRLRREEIGTAPGAGTANAAVRYPLFRYTAANMFAGSILNLDSGHRIRMPIHAFRSGWCGWAIRESGYTTHAEGAAAERRTRVPRLSRGVDWT
jgi:hypothetical protein